MIKYFCDCCGKEVTGMENEFPLKRISIRENEYYNKDYLVKFSVSASVYTPKNLLNEAHNENFVGDVLCGDCILEYLTQVEK